MTRNIPRIVSAPTSSVSAELLPNCVLSVALDADEDVQWMWTHTANGSYVSGYRVTKKQMLAELDIGASK